MMGFKGSAVLGGKVGRVKMIFPMTKSVRNKKNNLNFGNFVKIPWTNNYGNQKKPSAWGFFMDFRNLSPVPCALPPLGS